MLCWVLTIGRKRLKNILWVPASLRAKLNADEPPFQPIRTAMQERLVLIEGDTKILPPGPHVPLQLISEKYTYISPDSYVSHLAFRIGCLPIISKNHE